MCSDSLVIAFDDVEAARLWYDSDEYRAIRGLRQGSGRSDVHLVAGDG